MVFAEEKAPPSGIRTAIESRSPRRRGHYGQNERTAQEGTQVTLSSLNLNQTPRDKTGRASTVEGTAEQQELAPPNPFRPALIPKLKRPVTIQNEMPTSLSSGGAQRYNHILKKK